MKCFTEFQHKYIMALKKLKTSVVSCKRAFSLFITIFQHWRGYHHKSQVLFLIAICTHLFSRSLSRVIGSSPCGLLMGVIRFCFCCIDISAWTDDGGATCWDGGSSSPGFPGGGVGWPPVVGGVGNRWPDCPGGICDGGWPMLPGGVCCCCCCILICWICCICCMSAARKTKVLTLCSKLFKLHRRPWQTCSFQHQFDFSGRHSAMQQLLSKDCVLILYGSHL